MWLTPFCLSGPQLIMWDFSLPRLSVRTPSSKDDAHSLIRTDRRQTLGLLIQGTQKAAGPSKTQLTGVTFQNTTTSSAIYREIPNINRKIPTDGSIFKLLNGAVLNGTIYRDWKYARSWSWRANVEWVGICGDETVASLTYWRHPDAGLRVGGKEKTCADRAWGRYCDRQLQNSVSNKYGNK